MFWALAILNSIVTPLASIPNIHIFAHIFPTFNIHIFAHLHSSEIGLHLKKIDSSMWKEYNFKEFQQK